MKPYYDQDGITLFCADNREVLPTLGKFDLLLTDPPYGIGESSKKNASRGTGSKRCRLGAVRDYGDYEWDSSPADADTIAIARSMCGLQIIWGGNYFDLPPCRGPLVWDKMINGDFADGEMAWNNLGSALRIKRHLWNGMIRKDQEDRVHPTQKPLDIMSWCLEMAALDLGDSVLDPWCGSGTTLVAAKLRGMSATGIEINEAYCRMAVERLRQGVLIAV